MIKSRLPNATFAHKNLIQSAARKDILSQFMRGKFMVVINVKKNSVTQLLC